MLAAEGKIHERSDSLSRSPRALFSALRLLHIDLVSSINCMILFFQGIPASQVPHTVNADS